MVVVNLLVVHYQINWNKKMKSKKSFYGNSNNFEII